MRTPLLAALAAASLCVGAAHAGVSAAPPLANQVSQGDHRPAASHEDALPAEPSGGNGGGRQQYAEEGGGNGGTTARYAEAGGGDGGRSQQYAEAVGGSDRCAAEQV